MKKYQIMYKEEFIKVCRELGIGDLTIEHRPISGYPLSKEHWLMIHYALLSFEHQVKLIVADAVARERSRSGN